MSDKIEGKTMKITIADLLKFKQGIASHIDAERKARNILESFGPAVIEECTKTISMRELARRTEFSITYLSFVKNKKVRLSSDAFLAVLEQCITTKKRI